MKDQRTERGIRWLAMASAFYGASFFVVMAIVCRSGIQLSDAQLHVMLTVYRPVYKVLPSPVMSKGLEVCAGLSEIEAFFFFNHPSSGNWQTQ